MGSKDISEGDPSRFSGSATSFDIAFALFTWLIEQLSVELKEQLAGTQLEVIRAEYHGPYPAIGIHYQTNTTQDLGPLVEATITRLLKERPVMDFVSYAERSTIDWRGATDKLMKAAP